jgi:hypothetical protein
MNVELHQNYLICQDMYVIKYGYGMPVYSSVQTVYMTSWYQTVGLLNEAVTNCVSLHNKRQTPLRCTQMLFIASAMMSHMLTRDEYKWSGK